MTDAARESILLGVGNLDRGDDAAGRIAARLLHDAVPPGIGVVECDGEATSLLTLLTGRDLVVVVDACQSGQPAGTVRRFDVSTTPLPSASYGVSTHGLGLDAALELARSLGQLPSRCIVYAVEGQDFTTGAGLSPPVAAAVRDVVPALVAEFAAAGAPAGRS